MGWIGFEHIDGSHATDDDRILAADNTTVPIHYRDENGEVKVDEGPGPYVVTWQTSPVLKKYDVNYNLFKDPLLGTNVRTCFEDETVVFGGFEIAPPGNIDDSNAMTSFFATLHSFESEKVASYDGSPMARLYLPVYDSFNSGRNVTAVTMAILNWEYYFANHLPQTMKGIAIVLENECDGSFTYDVHGKDVLPIGYGDYHDRKFDVHDRVGSFEEHYIIDDGSKHGLSVDNQTCPYRLHVYPTQVRRYICLFVEKSHNNVTKLYS
jgi:hypothetical protein